MDSKEIFYIVGIFGFKLVNRPTNISMLGCVIMIIPVREPKESQKDYAMRIIRENIIKWELMPGTQLSVNQLAEALGLPRIPVHEALKELAKVKIVEIYPQRGTRIAPIDYDLIDEAVFARQTFESAIVELACKIAGEQDYVWFENHLDLQNYYWNNANHEMLITMDHEYHRHYYEICKKLQCYEMICSMSIHFDRVRHISMMMQTDKKLVEDHRKIFEAVKAKKPEQAKTLVHNHLVRYQVERDEIERVYSDLIRQRSDGNI